MYLDLHPHEQHATEIWRVVEPQPTWIESSCRWLWWLPEHAVKSNSCDFVCTASREWHEYLLDDQKPWKPGDVLACREEWCPLRASDYAAAPRSVPLPQDREKVVISYRSDHFDPSGDAGPLEWRLASTLPDWAIRRRVTVRQVEVRRVSTITEEEAMAAGFVAIGCGVTGRCVPDPEWARDGFREWWDSAFPAHPWASEPWAWRVVVESLNKE